MKKLSTKLDNKYVGTIIKRPNGITLISLVVTIVVLIILAGVAINLSIGDNGIFNKAKYAKEQQKMAEVQEKIELAIVDIQSDKISKGEECTVDTIITELPGKINGLTISKDGENGKGTYNGCDFTITPSLKTTIDGYNPTTGGSTTEGNITGGNTTGGSTTVVKSEVEQYKDTGTYFDKETIVKDSNGNLIKVPEGFKIAQDSGKNVTEGIVIEDNDIIEGIGNNRGNQYVWIPVGEGIKKSDGTSVDIILGRYTFANGTNDKAEDGETILAKGTPILLQSAENYEEVLINSDCKELTISRTGKVDTSDRFNDTNTTALNLKGFIDSVKANGGYYIARYEASYGTDGKANSKVSNSYSEDTAPTTEGTLWNNITQIDAATASRNLYTTATTDLINSYAWDTAIVYIQNFSGDTDYSYQTSLNKSLANTGTNGDEVCKINDMASNTREWSTENCKTWGPRKSLPCIFRGGCYNAEFETKTRCNEGADDYNRYGTFRPVLYM